MRKFKDFLMEGGGTLTTDDGQASVPVDVSTPEKRRSMQKSVHKTLSAINDHFKANHQTDLFKDRLVTGSAYSGSSKSMMDKKIPHAEYSRHKPAVGDVDVKIDHGHRDIVAQGLRHGQTFGDHTILKVHRRGEVHALARHNPSGAIHQLDFEPVHDPDHPFTDFSRSSSFADSKVHPDIKGMHHKMLLNAAGGDRYKFGTRGLVNRSNENDSTKEIPEIGNRLFGSSHNNADIHSFTGVARTMLIYTHSLVLLD
jgi:hypothetical protein